MTDEHARRDPETQSIDLDRTGKRGLQRGAQLHRPQANGSGRIAEQRPGVETEPPVAQRMAGTDASEDGERGMRFRRTTGLANAVRKVGNRGLETAQQRLAEKHRSSEPGARDRAFDHDPGTTGNAEAETDGEAFSGAHDTVTASGQRPHEAK